MPATTRTRKSGKPRTLTRERVVRTAVALADERGLQDLTMRNLASAPNVEAMSLYNHLANKGDLVDGMIQLVFSRFEPATADGDWKDEPRKRAVTTLAG